MELQTVEFSVKGITEADGVGTFEGYAAVFGNIDRVNDIIEPGAFEGSFKRASDVSLLWAHSLAELIGGFKEIKPDSHGLFVKGELNLEVQRGREAYHLMKAGHLNKMSIGYRTKSFKDEVVQEKYIRRITSVYLYEISLISVPANDQADIISVKSLTGMDSSANLTNLNQLARNSGFSRSQTDRITGIVKKWVRGQMENPQGITEAASGDTAEIKSLIKGFSFLN